MFDESTGEPTMKAYVFIIVAPGKSTDVVAAVRRISGVKSADICWGLPDIVALMEAADATALQELVLDKIQKIAGVSQTATHIIFE